jgi:uncharacterized protein with HEPN domain
MLSRKSTTAILYSKKIVALIVLSKPIAAINYSLKKKQGRCVMPRKKSSSLIADIIKCGERIIVYTEGLSFTEFIRDPKTVDAVVRNFQIIGEAAGRLPRDFKQKHSRIPWKQIRAFRNRIVHHYTGVEQSVWEGRDAFLKEMLLVLRSTGK